VRLPIGPRRWLVREITRLLTTPLPNYARHVANDLDKLKQHARKGDVILVDGNERVSLVIKYLTQSSWSHIAVYVGDEPIRRDPSRRAELEAQFGDEAEFLMVEALMEGVVFSPLSKYLEQNMRVCRPMALRREDRDRILDELLSRVGHRYDLKNIVDLARYFFPVSFVPQRFRARALTVGSGEPTAVICSSMIAEAFQNVGFPILPRVERLETQAPSGRPLFGFLRRGGSRASRFFKQPPPLVTPRDFDLSPYFEIVKYNLFEEMRFDYRKILWVDGDDAANS